MAPKYTSPFERDRIQNPGATGRRYSGDLCLLAREDTGLEYPTYLQLKKVLDQMPQRMQGQKIQLRQPKKT